MALQLLFLSFNVIALFSIHSVSPLFCCLKPCSEFKALFYYLIMFCHQSTALLPWHCSDVTTLLGCYSTVLLSQHCSWWYYILIAMCCSNKVLMSLHFSAFSAVMLSQALFWHKSIVVLSHQVLPSKQCTAFKALFCWLGTVLMPQHCLDVTALFCCCNSANGDIKF